MSISARIKYFRNIKGLSQENVAMMLGIKSTNYAKYESGERTPKHERLVQIAKILDTDIVALETGFEKNFQVIS